MSMDRTEIFCVTFQLQNTKSHDGKTTLLHYFAETVEAKYPEVMGFVDELIHVDKAARGNYDILIRYN